MSPLPCHAVGPYSCKRVCGRVLDCQNHTCMKECHRVTEADVCTGKNKVISLGWLCMCIWNFPFFQNDTISTFPFFFSVFVCFALIPSLAVLAACYMLLCVLVLPCSNAVVMHLSAWSCVHDGSVLMQYHLCNSISLSLEHLFSIENNFFISDSDGRRCSVLINAQSFLQCQ